jgi:hypothetical protein
MYLNLSESRKESLNVEGAWYSPNIVSTSVHGQAFRIKI